MTSGSWRRNDHGRAGVACPLEVASRGSVSACSSSTARLMRILDGAVTRVERRDRVVLGAAQNRLHLPDRPVEDRLAREAVRPERRERGCERVLVRARPPCEARSTMAPAFSSRTSLPNVSLKASDALTSSSNSMPFFGRKDACRNRLLFENVSRASTPVTDVERLALAGRLDLCRRAGATGRAGGRPRSPTRRAPSRTRPPGIDRSRCRRSSRAPRSGRAPPSGPALDARRRSCPSRPGAGRGCRTPTEGPEGSRP